MIEGDEASTFGLTLGVPISYDDDDNIDVL